MKASAIIQARFNATRLPSKVMMKIMGKTILEYVIERVGSAKNIDRIVVATTTEKGDLPIVKLAEDLGIAVFRGSEDDVLDRYYKAARSYRLKHIVRVTADCPLIDPEIIGTVVERYFESGADYCSNILVETFPDGQDLEVFKSSALAEAWKNAKLSSEREHVTPYIKKNPSRFKLVSVENRTDLSDKRWTLDRKEDFEFIKAVLESLYPIDPAFHMSDVLELLRKDPSLEGINKNIVRNEGYLKSLKEDKPFKASSRKA